MPGITTEWKRSTFCADRSCVEVAVIDGDRVAMRDNKQVDGAPLTFSREDWAGFLAWLTESGTER
jgi:hypothetical protein